MLLETSDHAPDYVKKAIIEVSAERSLPANFNACIVARRYTAGNPPTHPALRDKTELYEAALKGFCSDEGGVHVARFKGHELHERFGFEPVGAQFVHDFEIYWAT